MSNELKPCPFCGSESISANPYPDEYGSAVCDNCGSGTNYGELKMSIELWNQRPIEDALRAELEKTQNKIDAIPAFLQAVKYYWSRVRTGEYTDVRGGQTLTNMAIDKFIALIGASELPLISGDDSEYDYPPEQFGAEFGGAE